jgi:hypothetical protein
VDLAERLCQTHNRLACQVLRVKAAGQRQATAANGKPPRPQLPMTSPSHPGGGKAEQITRAQGCGLASRRPQRQPPPPATKSRRTCEALAPRDTLKAKPLGAGCSNGWGVKSWIKSLDGVLNLIPAMFNF